MNRVNNVVDGNEVVDANEAIDSVDGEDDIDGADGNDVVDCVNSRDGANGNEVVDGEDGADDSDFYDPDNNIEVDDDDLIFEENVGHDIERDWIVPPQSQTKTTVLEEDSDYALSDVVLSDCESDDDSIRRYPEFNANADMANPEFKVGMIFGSFKEFKCAVKEYAIKNRRNIQFEKNDTVRVKVVCKGGCPWNIWVSRMGKETDNVQVKTYNSSHTCANEHNIKFLTVDWLVKRYLDVFRADPRWSLPGIIHQIKSDLYMEISTQKAWNVKFKALKILAGKEGAQYAKLQDYAAELKKSNVGSAIFYDLQYQVFRRAYICLAACKNGFLAGCRRILSFDGCYLKGRYGGQLLSAIGIDSNDCIFPIAYAVVETENTNSWHWFLQLLANDLGIANSHAWTFMSDRQKVFLI
jgi:MuDR family transposase/MULE transposase domain